MSNLFTRPDAHISLFHWGKIRESRLKLAAPAFLRGLTAVYLADVHLRAGVPDAWLAKLLDRVAAARPDLLLLGGDYAEAPEQQRRFFTALGAVCRPRLGTFGVAGNNDRECFPEIGDLRACMALGGARLLLNEAQVLPLDGGRLAIAGIDEEKYGDPREEDLFDGCGADYRLLLAHMPRWPQTEVDLVLSGHTHGGQLNFCGLTPYSVGFEHAVLPLVRGTARRGRTTLLVSRGLGCSRLPLRVGAYPEYHVIEFSQAEGSWQD